MKRVLPFWACVALLSACDSQGDATRDAGVSEGARADAGKSPEVKEPELSIRVALASDIEPDALPPQAGDVVVDGSEDSPLTKNAMGDIWIPTFITDVVVATTQATPSPSWSGSSCGFGTWPRSSTPLG